ncbi:hypothetical protein D3C76_792670 [compost metagenome]
MSGLSQCRDRDVGDVFCVDKRLRDRPDGEGQFTFEDRFEKVRFAEVLAEPTGPEQGPVDATVLHHAFGLLRLDLPAARQQHQLAHA